MACTCIPNICDFSPRRAHFFRCIDSMFWILDFSYCWEFMPRKPRDRHTSAETEESHLAAQDDQNLTSDSPNSPCIKYGGCRLRACSTSWSMYNKDFLSACTSGVPQPVLYTLSPSCTPTALAKSHRLGFLKLPGLKNSLHTSKTKTLGEILKINKFWLPFLSLPNMNCHLVWDNKSLTYNVVTLVKIFHSERAWSGFSHPGANEC